MNGHLYATSTTVSDKEKFAVVLLNRPLLVLKGEFGLVGYKVKAKDLLECNKSVHDTIYVEHQDNGEYHLKGK
jgi:fascin 1/2